MTGSGFWTTTSGASAEFMVIVRVWPSGFVGFGSVGLDSVGEVFELLRFWKKAADETGSGRVLLVAGVTTCFSTSDAAFGSARARIWGSEDKGSERGKVLGKKRFKEDREDFPRLWFVYCFGMGGTLGARKSERRLRSSLEV